MVLNVFVANSRDLQEIKAGNRADRDVQPGAAKPEELWDAHDGGTTVLFLALLSLNCCHGPDNQSRSQPSSGTGKN